MGRVVVELAIIVLVTIAIMGIGGGIVTHHLGTPGTHWCAGYCAAREADSSLTHGGECYCRSGDQISSVAIETDRSRE